MSWNALVHRHKIRKVLTREDLKAGMKKTVVSTEPQSGAKNVSEEGKAVTTGWQVTGASSTVNGIYKAEDIPMYRGAQTYRKQGTNIYIVRWSKIRWHIRDFGPAQDNFPEKGADNCVGSLYTASCTIGLDSPSVTGWLDASDVPCSLRLTNIEPLSDAIVDQPLPTGSDSDSDMFDPDDLAAAIAMSMNVEADADSAANDDTTNYDGGHNVVTEVMSTPVSDRSPVSDSVHAAISLLMPAAVRN